MREKALSAEQIVRVPSAATRQILKDGTIHLDDAGGRLPSRRSTTRKANRWTRRYFQTEMKLR